MIERDLVTKIEPFEEDVDEENLPNDWERYLVTKIEPFEEDVAEENLPFDWERSCHQNRSFWGGCNWRKSATWLREILSPK